MQKAVTGSKAMVVSPHHLATAAGAKILAQGGNAFDAAVAVSATLAVVYPHMTSVGGDSFWLTWQHEERKVQAYNGSGRTGHQVTRDLYAGRDAIPQRGIESAITVPGMVDSWDAVLTRYGTLTLKDVLAPAIAYAKEGFPFSKDQHANTRMIESVLREQSASSIYLPNGDVPAVHSRFVQTALGTSLQKIADGGRDVFYKGDIAKEITRYMADNGGYLTLADFESHRGEWSEPLSTTYHDQTIYEVPPNSQGFCALEALNILENFDFSTFKEGSYEYYHLLVEALKQAFQDRNAHLTDPDFHDIPLDQLLSKSYAKTLADNLSLDEARPLTSAPVGHDTAYAAVVDEQGNAVSFIQSLYFEFGSAVVAGDTGILLQNRGSFFSLDETHVNALASNKRTFHTLMPAMALQHDEPVILFGTQGGEGQPQTQLQTLLRMLHYSFDAQQAVSAPRFVWGRTWGAAANEKLRIENRVPSHVVKQLCEAGHDVEVVESFDGAVGHAHAIQRTNDGLLVGGFDPRSDGAAFGF